MPIDPISHRIDGARWCPSPNHGDAFAAGDPTLIVLHAISLPPGEFGGPWIDALFTNALDGRTNRSFGDLTDLEVSSHLLIRRDGALVQYVPFDRRAWHAGDSVWRGRAACNDYSIGIELEGHDEAAFEKAQYAALRDVIEALIDAYPTLSWDAVVGHCHVAPGRKTDPGPGFDWSELRSGP